MLAEILKGKPLIPHPSTQGLKDLTRYLVQSSGAAAVAGSWFDDAMKSIWSFADALLTGALDMIDNLTAPDVNPASGPLKGVLPTTMWLGEMVVVLMGFVQIGRSVSSGGRGFGRLLIGFAQYVVVSTCGLGVLTTMVAASDSLANGILSAGLNIKNWQGLSAKNSFLDNATNAVSGVGLGLIALFCVIPAALGYLLEALARSAAILILAATTPILAAGLISDATRRWFWTGLRWMLALLTSTPATALAVVIGLRLAAGAAGADGEQQAAGQAAVGAALAGTVLLVSLCCPMALFKLFAFVDPTSLSGAAVRGYLRGGGGAGGSPSGSSMGSPRDAFGSDDPMRQRMGMAWGMYMDDTVGRAADRASFGSGILDAVGAGWPGGPDPGTSRGEGSSSSNPEESAHPQGSEPGTIAGPAAPTGEDVPPVDSPTAAGGSDPSTVASPVAPGTEPAATESSIAVVNSGSGSGSSPDPTADGGPVTVLSPAGGSSYSSGLGGSGEATALESLAEDGGVSPV